MKKEELKDQEPLKVNNTIGIILKVTHGYVDMEHGSNEDGDYIWHFMPSKMSRLGFPEDLKLVYQVLVTHLKKIIPADVLVQVYPPEKMWEVKLITVAARKLKKHWTFEQEQMDKYLPIIGKAVTETMVRI